MKTKNYDIYYSGSAKITSVCASCISKACKKFIDSNSLNAKYSLDSDQQAKIRCSGNYSIASDYVVIEI